MTQSQAQMQAQLLINGLNQSALQLRKAGQRQLVLLSGDIEWAWQLLNTYCGAATNNMLITPKSSILQNLLSNTPKLNNRFTLIRPDKPNTMLGFNCSNAALDCSQGFYPDAITAISGTINPGGFLFVICPTLANWPNSQDEFAEKRTSYGANINASSPNMIQHFLNHCQAHQAITIKQSDSELKNTTFSQVEKLDTKSDWNPPTSVTADQAAIKSTILKHLNPRLNPDISNQPKVMSGDRYFSVIQADRGRGKSHLLGLISKALLESNIDNGINLYITAPNKTSLQSVFDQLQDNDDEASVTFLAPEHVLDTIQTTDLLIVDEAASLPLPLLMAWASHCKHVIFSTTTHGYEGTGKGFQIRFLEFLKGLTPNIHQHSLKQPIRYAQGDGLEQLIFSSFCLNSDPKGLSFKPSEIDLNNVHYRSITQTDFKKDTRLLEDVFSLLVQAHYQTRPSDLRDILDSPTLSVFGLFLMDNNGDEFLASACLISKEGGFTTSDEPLIQKIQQGKRRPKGHLIPQVLTLHMGQENPLTLNGARVIRIATLANFRKQNFASLLLNYVTNTLATDDCDYLGSSYADTNDVNAFWGKNGFTPVRIGNRLDKSSGTRSKLVLKGLSENGANLVSNCQAFLIAQQQTHSNFESLSDTEKELINVFISHTGSYEAVKDILQRCGNWKAFYTKQHPKKASLEFRNMVKQWRAL